MLRQVFQTEPIRYLKPGEYHGGYLLGIHYNPNPPFLDEIAWISGISCQPNDLCPDGGGSIYIWCAINCDWWPSWSTAQWRYSSTTGKFIKRTLGQQNLGGIMLSSGVSTSRMSKVYFHHLYSNELWWINLGTSITSPVGEEPDTEDTWTTQDVVTVDHFEQMTYFGYVAIDDVMDRFINTWEYGELQVNEWKSGKFLYKLQMPDIIVAITLASDSQVYVLLRSRGLLLVDYVRGEVMGMSRLPPSLTGATDSGYWNNTDLGGIAWDPQHNWILTCEHTPDNPDGTATSYVRGFRLVPEPVRITTPIPLRVPRQRRTIPVMAQIVGDRNEGIGGYTVTATATGSGSVVGVPVTDYRGMAFIQIACEGSPQFSPDVSFDWAGTGSPEADPPHAGLVTVTASVVVPIPEMPLSGVVGGATDATGGVPGAPGDGTDPGTSLPETAPNMTHILNRVYGLNTWNLAEENEDAPNGRGAFTEAAVTAMHDEDARWGNIDKNPGQNQYNGHAVDAICFKNDDGVTAEIFDIVSGGGQLIWGFSSRGTGELGLWKYPA